jgi:hypothetical protein
MAARRLLQIDQVLFRDPSNWQGLCRSHHSRDKQAEERGFRKRRRIGVDGYPITD